MGFLAALLLPLVPSALTADSVGIKVGFWSPVSGTRFYKSELEERFFLDDLIRGTSTGAVPGKFNLGFINEDQYAAPAAIFYSPGYLPQLRVEAEYYGVSGSPVYHSFSDLPAPTRMHLNFLQNFERDSVSGGAAYVFAGFFRKNPISALIVRAGSSRESLSFTQRSIIVGPSGSTISPFDNKWSQSATGAYLGGELVMPVGEKWSAYVRYDRSDAVTGRMRYSELQAATDASGNLQVQIDVVTSKYRMRRDLQAAGIQYHVAPDLVFSFGYRRMIHHVYYPRYLSYSLSTTGAALTFSPLSEVIADSLWIWREQKREIVGNSVVSIEKLIDF